MRAILGGLLAFFLLALAASTAAHAQIAGRVEMIGFDGEYRPGCWTPMLVRLQSTGAPTGFYEVRIWQHDLDGDLPYYATRVSLTADAGEQPFWTFFIPEPIRGGMTSDMSTTLELAQRLRITVHDSTGKELIQVPLASATARAVDPPGTPFGSERGTRLVLFVGAGQPPLDHYKKERLVGVKEDLTPVKMTPERLPENAIGYDGVDAIVWLEGDPAQLAASGSRRFEALEEYVRRGGHLVICTPPQWQQLAGFNDLLPVDISGTEQNALQSPVRELATRMRFNSDPRRLNDVSPWERFRTPLTIAVATPKPGAVVDIYSNRVEDPQRPEESTPWLVRMPLGYGCVSWVAQDMGQRDLADRANWGWPVVWEEILGASSSPLVDPQTQDKQRWGANGQADLGFAVLNAMNLTGRGATLMSVTVLFFIGYWVIVGPGAFFWLRYKHRATLNWFVFGLLALAATGMTMGMVRLILRGAPELRHVSLVRIDCGGKTPSIVDSGIGVYIPRDGPQEIKVAAGDGPALLPPSVTPFPIHPTLHRHRGGDRFLFPAPRQYRVEVPTDARAEAAISNVPFRTTMKRLHASWSGPVDERIEGQARLMPSRVGEGYIAGTLTNLTGKELRNVYIGFRHQMPGGPPSDWLLFVPGWAAGAKLDLNQAFNPPADKSPIDITVGGEKRIAPNRDFPVRGRFADWMDVFGGIGRATVVTEIMAIDDLGKEMPQSVPLLSFFNRFPAVPNPMSSGTFVKSRSELHRTGLRDWDMSNVLASGRLAIVAQVSDSALPMPVTIASGEARGRGMTIYQFALPLEPIASEPAGGARTTASTTTSTTTRPGSPTPNQP